MLAFRSEDDVDAWCRRRRLVRGALLDVGQAWDLSKAWYTGRDAAEWRGRTAAEAQAVLLSVGLTGPFWELGTDEGS